MRIGDPQQRLRRVVRHVLQKAEVALHGEITAAEHVGSADQESVICHELKRLVKSGSGTRRCSVTSLATTMGNCFSRRLVGIVELSVVTHRRDVADRDVPDPLHGSDVPIAQAAPECRDEPTRPYREGRSRRDIRRRATRSRSRPPSSPTGLASSERDWWRASRSARR